MTLPKPSCRAQWSFAPFCRNRKGLARLRAKPLLAEASETRRERFVPESNRHAPRHRGPAQSCEFHAHRGDAVRRQVQLDVEAVFMRLDGYGFRFQSRNRSEEHTSELQSPLNL